MSAYFAVQLSMHHQPREAVDLVREAVASAHGVIVDAARFSNKALSFKVECYAKAVPALVAALGRVGTVHTAHEQPDRAPPLATLPGETEVLVLLHVTLVHASPDERIELPKVPG